MVEIASDLVRHILALAASSPGAEICGLLFGDDHGINAAQPCRNAAADPTCWFEIDPAALISAHRAARAGGPRIIGHYHSHPSGSPLPSPRDAASATADGSLWLVVAGADVKAWRAVADGAVEGRFNSVPLRIVQP
jgi:proteasome lid subunit RPN8/RPN11